MHYYLSGKMLQNYKIYHQQHPPLELINVKFIVNVQFVAYSYIIIDMNLLSFSRYQYTMRPGHRGNVAGVRGGNFAGLRLFGGLEADVG